MKLKMTIFALIFVFSLSLVSAVSVTDVRVSKVFPGESTGITIEVKNILSDDVEDVSIALNLDNTRFTSVGSSEDSEEEIEEDDKENFGFTIKAANDITPGDYNIPYTLTYKILGEDETIERKGSFGVTVGAKTELRYTVDVENPIVGEQGQVIFKVINSGLGDIRFVSIRLASSGFTLLSDDEIYVGTVDSDDFETATFDVIFKSENPKVRAIIEYKDFNNEKIIEDVELPLRVYTQEEALELGIIQKNNTGLYVGVVVALIIIWFIYRAIKKRRRNKKKLEAGR
jgi:hypothetical protein